MAIRLGIVVPCYNEEEVLPETNRRLLDLLNHLQQSGLVTANSTLYFVDDGSKDHTWEIIESLAAVDTRVHGIKLSRNRGHQNALLAGLFGAEGDAVVTVDADLQDDITIIEEMVHRFSEGCEIVYGVRKSPVRRIPLSNGAALECTTSSLPGWVSMSFTTMPTSGS